MIARIWLLPVLIGLPVVAAAAPCEDLANVEERLSCLEAQHCADAKTDSERAKCYEDIVRGLLTGTSPAPERVEPPAQAEDEVEEAVTDLEETKVESGTAPEDAFGRQPEPVYQGEEPKEIGATITHLVEQRDGRLLIGLANGQVWEENEASPQQRVIKIGSTAEISKVLFGYMMRFEGARSSRVKRLPCDSGRANEDVIRKCRLAGYGDS